MGDFEEYVKTSLQEALDAHMDNEFEAFVTEQLKNPKFLEAYREAKIISERSIKQLCSYGNCVEFLDPVTNIVTSGWGPVGCECQD